ncbi:MAG: TonB-dependent receptor [Betaproteobacteria bacterium]|nr:TonB-dependent receptor [Betaproteobacteria bacterium]
MHFRPLGAAIAALFSAQGLAADEPITVTEVVVIGKRVEPLPWNGMKVPAASLKALAPATSDTASLLRDVPGVSLMGAGGVSSLPVIHGLADDRVRTLVDGMDLIAACPNHMNPALSYIDPTQVGGIQVFAGVTPVSVGGDSIGGAIIVESARPVFAGAGEGLRATGEMGGFYRSNGNAHGINLAATLANERVSVGYVGAVAESDNYKAGDDFKTVTYTGQLGHALALDEVGSTAYKSTNNALTIALRGDDNRLDLKLSHQSIPFENFPNQRMDMTGNESDQVNLGYTGQFQWGQLKARAYYEHTRHEMDFGSDKRFWYGTASGGAAAQNGTPCSPISATCAAGMPMYTDGNTAGVSVHAEILRNERDTFRLGGEYLSYRLDDWWPPSGAGMWPGTFWNINDGRRDRYAVFGEWEGRLNPQWASLLGVRHESVDMDAGLVRGYNTAVGATGSQQVEGDAFNARSHGKTDRNLDLTASARYTADKTRNYEVGFAQKTRSPNLYQRYTWSTWTMAAVMNNFLGDGNGYVGDIDLKPEVARTLSFTGDWHDADKSLWGFKVTPYYTDVKDYIDARCNGVCTANQFNVLKYVNRSARLYGVDVSGRYLATSASALGSLTVSGLVNYTQGKNEDTGDNLYNIMPLHGKLALTQKQGNWSNVLEGVFVAGKVNVSTVRNEIRTGGYSLFNLRSSYVWKQVRLDFGIENLFDKGYAQPQGGAYTGQGSTMSINPATTPLWGVAVTGPGRSLYAGVNVKF